MSREYREKRIKELKLYIIVSTVVLVWAFLGLAVVVKSSRANAQEIPVEKTYVSQVIYCGDTLESIVEGGYQAAGYADKDVYLRNICQINKIFPDTQLIPGNYLVLPRLIRQ